MVGAEDSEWADSVYGESAHVSGFEGVCGVFVVGRQKSLGSGVGGALGEGCGRGEVSQNGGGGSVELWVDVDDIGVLSKAKRYERLCRSLDTRLESVSSWVGRDARVQQRVVGKLICAMLGVWGGWTQGRLVGVANQFREHIDLTGAERRAVLDLERLYFPNTTQTTTSTLSMQGFRESVEKMKQSCDLMVVRRKVYREFM